MDELKKALTKKNTADNSEVKHIKEMASGLET